MVDQPFPEEGGDAASYRHIRNVCKALRSLVDPFLLPEKAFIKKFRLSKPLVRELIEDLTPFIAFGGHGGAVSVETKVPELFLHALVLPSNKYSKLSIQYHYIINILTDFRENYTLLFHRSSQLEG